MESGFIRNNKDRKHDHKHPRSINNYGQQMGYVNLFNIKDCNEEELEDVSSSFYFYNPEYVEDRPCFFIMKEEIRNELISWEEARKSILSGKIKGNYIPHGECYYPRDLPLDLVKEVLIVNVVGRKKPEPGSLLWLNKQINKNK